MSVLGFCQWLESTGVSVSIRESTWTYPIIESVHVLSLCLFLGMALLWDLRLLNVTFRRVSVSELKARLMPWITGGFVLMVISGLLLFWSDPVRFYGNVFFRIKLVALVCAGLNAFVFHATIGKRLIDWDTGPRSPRRAQLAGALSILLWSLIVVCGRFIAYNWFKPLA